MIGKARKVAMNRMLSNPEAIGADAVISVRYTTATVVGSAPDLLAYPLSNLKNRLVF